VRGDFCSDPFDYPFKFLPAGFSGNIEYSPQNLRYGYEQLSFESRDASAVEQDLHKLAFTLKSTVSLAADLTAASVREQIARLGEGAWCEQMWIEDCERYMTRTAD
jgi:hypothetical protein